MICVVHVDDTIITGPDSDAIQHEIKLLGITNDEYHHKFRLRDEGEVGDFLGIRIKKTGPNQFNLTQPGLIDKVIRTGMGDSKAVNTPSITTNLGIDKDGLIFSEAWDCATIMRMLMYLNNKSRPDIAFAVHQCARFTHAPTNSHSVAVKRILRYLNGSRDKGMMFKPTNELRVDYYVDADFAGLFGIEHEQDSISVKFQTGYLITFMGVPLQWVSKLQTQITLSTMEAEYIALSKSMRDLIAIREVLKEISSIALQETKSPTYHAHSKTFQIPQSTVFEDNQAC